MTTAFSPEQLQLIRLGLRHLSRSKSPLSHEAAELRDVVTAMLRTTNGFPAPETDLRILEERN